MSKGSHLASVSSVSSSMSDTLDKFENTPVGRGQNISRDDVDLEQQIIITAGGRKEYIMCFLFKLLVLILKVVVGCGVLVFMLFNNAGKCARSRVVSNRVKSS